MKILHEIVDVTGDMRETRGILNGLAFSAWAFGVYFLFQPGLHVGFLFSWAAQLAIILAQRIFWRRGLANLDRLMALGDVQDARDSARAAFDAGQALSHGPRRWVPPS